VVTIALAAAEHGHDVAVVQLRRDVRFAAEPFELVARQQRRLRQHLQRHTAAERLLHRVEHDAHAAATQLADDAEVAELRQRRQRDAAAPTAARRTLAFDVFERDQRRQQLAQALGMGRVLLRKGLDVDGTLSMPLQELLGQQVQWIALGRFVGRAHGSPRLPRYPLSRPSART
jgi:hypothetical protein